MNYQLFLKGVVYKMNISFIFIFGELLGLLKQMTLSSMALCMQ